VARSTTAGVVARLCLALLAAASVGGPALVAAEEAAVMGIAPTEHDLEAMRRTVRRLEKVINTGGSPDAARSLVSPNVPPSRRDAIVDLVRRIADALPPNSRYALRTDFTGASLTPTGTDRVQLQITATRLIRFAMSDESVQLELEAVETESRRAWLLCDLGFPGQQTLLPKELSETPRALVVLAAGVAALCLVLVAWWLWRWRARRRGARVTS
jgi:hypothetical protein